MYLKDEVGLVPSQCFEPPRTGKDLAIVPIFDDHHD